MKKRPANRGRSETDAKEKKKEEILLDATLGDEIGYATFRAKLDNDHAIIAFTLPKKIGAEAGLKPGMRVRVQLSSYDMFKGKIIL